MTDPSPIAMHFDRRAACYAEKYRVRKPRHVFELEKQQRLQWTLEWIHRYAERRDSTTLLDVGCGDGQLIRRLTKRVVRCRALGIDVAPAMIERARASAAEDRAAWQVAQPHEVTGNFDVVTCLGVIGYQRDQVAFLRTLAERVAAGGNLILSFGNRYSIFRQLRQSVQAARRVLCRRQQAVRFRSISLARLNAHLSPEGFQRAEVRWLTFGIGISRGGRFEASTSKLLESAFSRHVCSQYFAQVGLAKFTRDT